MSSRTPKRLLVTVAVLLVVSACGGTNSEVEPTQTSGDTATTAARANESIDGTADDSAADDSAGSGEPDTLDDYLGTGFFSFDPEEQAANYARQEQRVQELIAECMALEGFEYVAATRPIGDLGIGTPGDVEFAGEHGFGITTFYGETEAPWFDQDWVDPNQSIVESLSESEQDAYDEALYGSSFSIGAFGIDGDSAASTTEDGTVADDVDDFEGCSGQAYEQVYAFEDLQEIYEQLDLDSLFERVEADPRTAEMYVEWSECMSERGYEYDDPDALYEVVYVDFQERLEEIVGTSGGFFDPFAGMSEEEVEELMNSMSPEEMEDFFAQGQQSAETDIDQGALAALQAEERALAVVNAECSEGLVEQFLELYEEYEAALVNENRALLEQFRDRREG